ncbi:MAG: hypothetical protein EOP07_10395 [Proteobacteria bacterium]|nr:MAG: hypothetical protein EOP07_10395 [Pseudomonadota bacterium]
MRKILHKILTVSFLFQMSCSREIGSVYVLAEGSEASAPVDDFIASDNSNIIIPTEVPVEICSSDCIQMTFDDPSGYDDNAISASPGFAGSNQPGSGSGGSNLDTGSTSTPFKPSLGSEGPDHQASINVKLEKLFALGQSIDAQMSSKINSPVNVSVGSQNSSVDVSRLMSEAMERMQRDSVSSIVKMNSAMEQQSKQSQVALIQIMGLTQNYENLRNHYDSQKNVSASQLSEKVGQEIPVILTEQRSDVAERRNQSKLTTTQMALEVETALPESGKVDTASPQFLTNPFSQEGQAVRKANAYVQMARREVDRATGSVENREAALKLLASSSEAIHAADKAYASGDREAGEVGLQVAYRLADVAITLAPLVLVLAAPQAVVAISIATTISFAKDWYEYRSGHRLFGGEKLTPFDRSMAAFGAATSIPGLKILGSAANALGKTIDAMGRLGRISKAGTVAVEDAEALVEAEVAAQKLVTAVTTKAPLSVEQIRSLKETYEKVSRSGFTGSFNDFLQIAEGFSKFSSRSGIGHIFFGEVSQGAKLGGGLHTQSGLKELFARNPALEAMTKIENSPSGILRIHLPREAMNSSEWSRTVSAGMPGMKTLFPPTWNFAKVTQACELVAKQRLSIGELNFASEGIVDGVKIKVVVENGLIKTAFPIWDL